MKTEVKKIDNSKKEISIEVNGDIVKNKFLDAYKRIAKEAKVPGFRVGHAPRDILEKNFSRHAHELVIKELVPDIYNQAIEKEGLDVIELPDISDVKLDGNSLSFRARVEIRPEIPIKDYKGVKINYKKVNVSDDEIKRSLDSLKESRKLENIDDNFAKGLGYPSLSKLQEAVKRQLYLQKENIERQKIEQETVESVMKGLDFKTPQTMVNRQLQDLIRQAKLDLALKGMPAKEIEGQEKELAQSLLAQAEKQVRVYLVLAEIAKREKIPIDDHMPQRVIEFLLKEANWQESD
jgi:FKBP-type peptidyl-prolyl cis-trans isomerase (trigger factor)